MAARSSADLPLSEIIPATRVDPLTLDAFEAARAEHKRKNPGAAVKRADFLRSLLCEALAARGFTTEPTPEQVADQRQRDATGCLCGDTHYATCPLSPRAA